MKRFLLRGTTALVWASTAAFAAAAPASAQESYGLSGSVGGIMDPAQGVLTLGVEARDSVGTLANVAVLVDGVRIGPEVALCQPGSTGGCQAEHADVPLDTRAFTDGTHRLAVVLTDSEGHKFSIVDRNFEVWNHRPEGQPSQTLTIGSGNTSGGSGTGTGNGNGNGSTEPQCKSPKLSMYLASKPVRLYKKKTPVLYKGKKYAFKGRLTCIVGRKRVSALKGTRIDVYNVVKVRVKTKKGFKIKTKTVRKTSTKVATKGRVSIKLSVPTSRAIEFRHKAADGKTSKVRIRVIVTKKKAKGK